MVHETVSFVYASHLLSQETWDYLWNSRLKWNGDVTHFMVTAAKIVEVIDGVEVPEIVGDCDGLKRFPSDVLIDLTT